MTKKLTESISMLQDIIQAYDETYTPIGIESLSVVDLRETKRNLETIIHQHEALVNSSDTNEDKDNRPTPVITTHPPKKGKTSYLFLYYFLYFITYILFYSISHNPHTTIMLINRFNKRYTTTTEDKQ